MNLAAREGTTRKASGTPQSPSRVRAPASGRRVLVVDDEESLRHMLQLMLRKEGYETVGVPDVQAALHLLEDEAFDIVLCDLRMPGRSGMDLVDEIRRQRLLCTVVVMTAYGSKDVAIEALKRGAYDYISKPFDSEELVLLLRKAEERERLAQENMSLRRQLAQVPAPDSVPGMVGKAPCMVDLYRTIVKVAEFRTTVLIQGESGTGKELVARALHALSPRHAAPFVAINCGAIPATLLESELFGHKRGAFTDATRDHKGLFEEANGGTIFLDEVADMPMPLQVKLLRTLQESHIRRVGDERDVPVDVRVVAASARDLGEAVAAGHFRNDLFYRLNVISLRVPPLRERREDIALLVAHLLQRLNERLGLSIKGVTTEAMAALMDAPWDGNVRELENALERAMVLADGDEVTLNGLPFGFAEVPPGHTPDVELRPALRRTEERLIREALQATLGNRTQAAQRLGVSHRTLLYKIREYGIAEADGLASDETVQVRDAE